MIDYVELHSHSYYSLLDGASSPQELIEQATLKGLPALALTDHNNVYGAVAFQKSAVEAGIQPIFGAEITLENHHHLTLLVKDETGWSNLCYLITQAQHNAEKGKGLLPIAELQNHTDGLIGLSGCMRGEIPSLLRANKDQEARCKLDEYVTLFGRENFWLELQHHLLPDDKALIQALVKLATKTGLSYVATNNVHYAHQDQSQLQDVLVCIQNKTYLDEASNYLRSNSEYYLKSKYEMQHLFAKYPLALENTVYIAEQCNYRLPDTLQHLPRYPIPDTDTVIGYLRKLCYQSPRCNSVALKKRLDHELEIVEDAGLANYFLVVWHIVQYARKNNIRCQGRGSASNSVIAYLLYISPVNPIQHGLVFERFLSKERSLTPDIDIDFDAQRREEVIQYVYKRYGLEHSAMASTFVTFRTKSAINDVAKAFGFTPSMASTVTEAWERYSENTDIHSLSNQELQQILNMCQQLKGLPRHLGIHNGGMIISEQALHMRVPTEPATIEGRYVVQFDKEGLEDVGIIKVDILGLRMLSAITEAEQLAGVDLETLDYSDPSVYKMISTADTIGVFQVESTAQAQMLPRFQPKNFNDIIIAISLIRPGPIQGNMVHPYLRRRMGKEPVTYLHDLLIPALEETLGVILFQEQVLKVAHDFAGFTHGQGELLRRALGSKNALHLLDQLEDIFIAGAVKKGIASEIAKTVFNKLRGFGSYSFAKSHASAFAVLVYQSAWLRYYHPLAFFVALLNNQPMGFWKPSVIVTDAKRHGIKFLSVDIEKSEAKCSIERGRLRLGLEYVKGIKDKASTRIIEERKNKPFKSLVDFCQRTQLPPILVESLIQAGAMDTWGIEKRALFWELGRVHYQVDELDLDYGEDEVELPDMTLADSVNMEFQAMGLSTEIQVMALYRPYLIDKNILSSRDIAKAKADSLVQIAGLLVIRQSPPTAKGMVFLTFEDEWGFISVIVRPDIARKYKRLIKSTSVLIVYGVVQREGQVVSVLAHHISSIHTSQIT